MNASGECSHPGVGVRLMDRDHDHLSEILGEIQFRVSAGLGSAKTGEMLRRLARHLRLHFDLEEGMMAASQYPGIAIHQLRHELLVDQVNALTTHRGRKALERNVELLNLLVTSHIKHVGHSDMHYGIWLNAGSPRIMDAASTGNFGL